MKNTGSVSGKSVVQLYVQTPYGDYEKQNAVEKSAVQVIGYGKTLNLSEARPVGAGHGHDGSLHDGQL